MTLAYPCGVVGYSQGDAQTYLSAARLVASGEHTFPCTAVHACDPARLNWHQPESITRRFILTMAPGREEFSTPAAASASYVRRLFGGLRDHSVLALCFMAAMEGE